MFLRFHMIQDGGVNETGIFLMSSLAGPTLVFMLYATVSSFRIRLGFWIFIDAAGGGSSYHCDRVVISLTELFEF